jgi:endoglucanase
MAHSVTLTWIASTDTVSGYNVYRGTSGAGSEGASPINGTTLVTGLTYVDTNVADGTSYEYYVEAVSAAGLSSVPSVQVSATVPVAPPTGLAAVAV